MADNGAAKVSAAVAAARFATITDPTAAIAAAVATEVAARNAAIASESLITMALTQIGGLKLWLRADTITGLADAAALSTWADSSGLRNNMGQAGAGTLKPSYRVSAAALNNKPVVRFDGGDWLGTGAPVTTVVDNYTLVAVLDPSSTTVCSVVHNGGPNDGWGLANSTNTTNKKGWLQGGTAWIDTTTAADLAPGVYTLERAAGTSTVYLNGTALTATSAATPLTPTSRTSLGSHTGTDSYFTGDIAEVLIFAAALTAAQRSTVHAYLGAKYGITVT